MLLRHAEVDGRFQADLRVSHGMITKVAPALRRRGDERVFDCRGGAVLPGLCDHHVHLHALAARAGSATSNWNCRTVPLLPAVPACSM